MFTPAVLDSFVAGVELDGRRIELALWDTFGQEEYARFRSLITYPGSHVILICYPIDVPYAVKNVVEKV